MNDKVNGRYVVLDKPKIIYEHGTSEKKIEKLERKKFDLVMTSPPYNVGKEYETQTSIQNYLKNQEKIICQVADMISDKGSLCWQVGNYVDKKTRELFPLDIYYYDLFKKHNLILRNRIIWRFGHGLHASSRFSGRYETILWFTKSDKYIFNLDNVRVPAKYPGKRFYKGPNKGDFSGNPLGVNPSDVWDILKKDWNNEIWEIPNSNHKEKTIHPCQYPIELVERCILALTNEGSWVLDPFAGVGSTLIAAAKNNRNAIGIEKYKKYIDIGIKRLNKFQDRTLEIRQLGQEIFKPNANMAVARKPQHFLY
jgi:adenine-specific DNA-methyltransferase